MKNVILIAILWALSVSVAHASRITIGSTVLSATGVNTTQFDIVYNDADNNLLLTMGELDEIVWEQTNSSGTTMGTSQPSSIGLGGIDFEVSIAEELISASAGYFLFGTTAGLIGIQGFDNGFINYYATCNASPCDGGFPYDTFTVSIEGQNVPEPTIVTLLGIGFLGMVMTRRRKKV